LGLGLLVVLALVVGYLELFRELDWGHGIWRATLVVVMAGVAYALLTRPRGLNPPAPRPFLVALAAAAALIVNLVAGVQAISRTLKTGEIEMDQGQNSYRAIGYLRAGANPYGQTAMLDPESWADLAYAVPHVRGCLLAPLPDNLEAALDRYWYTADPRATTTLLPAISQAPECKPFRIQSASLGYKYGPMLLASYLPFVLVFGKSGIFLTHLVLVLLSAGLLLWHGLRQRRPLSVVAGALLLFLAPSHLRHNVFEASASDLGPVLAATFAVMMLARGRDGWAAFFIGLSVASKTLPGVVYVPLLLACRPRTWVAFVAPVVVSFVPFLVWDGTGLVNNIVRFNLGRPTDSTALAHFLPRPGMLFVQAIGLLVLVLALLRARRRGWAPSAILAYLWVANAAALAGGTVFHNNYLLWLLPLLALTCLSFGASDDARPPAYQPSASSYRIASRRSPVNLPPAS
jgi:hypothetical protein